MAGETRERLVSCNCQGPEKRRQGRRTPKAPAADGGRYKEQRCFCGVN